MDQSTNLAQQNAQAEGFLKKLERAGNKLPHPAVLFIYLTVFIALLSAVLAYFKVSSIDPMSHKPIVVKSLMTAEGLHWMLSDMVKNYINFPPLGVVLVISMGIGLVEKVGLMETFIKFFVNCVPKRFVTFAVVLIAFMSHLASDAAFVIMPPIAAMVFHSLGRHPFAGFATGVAGVASGFTANLLIVTTDVLLSGISTQAAKIIDPNAMVSPIDNWFFMAFSVIYLSIITTIITEKFVEPRLGTYTGNKSVSLEKPSQLQISSLKATGWAVIIFFAILGLLSIPQGAILRNPQTGSLFNSPLMRGVVPLLFLFFCTIGLTYGFKVGILKKLDDVPKMMAETVKSLSGFMVMVFGIAQFIACFTWTNLATILATSGAAFLQNIQVTGLPAILCFMLLAQFVSLFVASGSAIWALLSPVFVPMFMLLGYHPAFIQVAFRVGDASLLPITPVSPFLPLFLDVLRQYKSDAGIGTHIALMLPYALSFLVFWYGLLFIWFLLGLPIGPGIYPHI